MYFFPGDLTITFGITVRSTIPFIWRRLSVIANLRYHFSNCQWCGKFWRANHSEFLLRIDDQNFDKCHIPIPRNSTPTHLQHAKLSCTLIFFLFILIFFIIFIHFECNSILILTWRQTCQYRNFHTAIPDVNFKCLIFLYDFWPVAILYPISFVVFLFYNFQLFVANYVISYRSILKTGNNFLSISECSFPNERFFC